MAKNYQRHSRGGRFKGRDSGDGGSRAIKIQADTIIDALKTQRARASEYGSDYVTDLKGVQRNEAENRRQLQELESKAYQNRLEAIDVRAKREVEALEGQAKEYGEKSKFWLDFSTKHAQNYAKLGMGIENFLAYKEFERDVERINAGDDLKSVTDGLAEQDEIIKNESQQVERNAIIKASKLYETGEKSAALKLLKDTVGSNNRYTSKWLADQIVENKTGWLAEVKANSPELWNTDRDKAINAYMIFTMGKLGLNPRSVGGRKLLSQSRLWANTEQLDLNNRNSAVESNQEYLKGIEHLQSIAKTTDEDTKYAISNNFNSLVLIKNNSYSIDKKGELVKPLNNMALSARGVFEDLLNTGKYGPDDFQKLWDLTYGSTMFREWSTDMSAEDAGKVKTWGENEFTKAENNNAFRELKEVYQKFQTQRGQDLTRNENAKIAIKTAEIEDQFTNPENPNYYDLTNSVQAAKATDAMWAAPPHLRKVYGKYLAWSESLNSVLTDSTHKQLINKLSLGDYDGFMFLFNKLNTEKERNTFGNLQFNGKTLSQHFERISLVNSSPDYSKENLEARYNELFRKGTGQFAVKVADKGDQSVQNATASAVQMFHYELENIDLNKLKGTSALVEADRIVRDRILEGRDGKGIYAITGTDKGSVKHFRIDQSDTGDKVSISRVKELVTMTKPVYNNWDVILNPDSNMNIINPPKSLDEFVKIIHAQKKEILSSSEYVTDIEAITRGESFNLEPDTIEVIEYLSNAYDVPVANIMRKLLKADSKSKGFLPPAFDEYAKILVGSNYKNYGKEEVSALHLYKTQIDSGNPPPMDTTIYNEQIESLVGLEGLKEEFKLDYSLNNDGSVNFYNTSLAIIEGWRYGVSYDPFTNKFTVRDD